MQNQPVKVMKRPVTSLCRRPGKKTACGQSVPDAGTISAHRDALRRAVRSAGQKPPKRGRKNSPRAGGLGELHPMGERWEIERVWCREASHWAPAGAEGTPGRKNSPRRGRRLSGCGIWVLLAPGDPCDLNAQGGQHSQAEDHAQLSQGEICHQEQAMQSGDQQHSQEQQHAHAEGSQ